MSDISTHPDCIQFREICLEMWEEAKRNLTKYEFETEDYYAQTGTKFHAGLTCRLVGTDLKFALVVSSQHVYIVWMAPGGIIGIINNETDENRQCAAVVNNSLVHAATVRGYCVVEKTVNSLTGEISAGKINQ